MPRLVAFTGPVGALACPEIVSAAPAVTFDDPGPYADDDADVHRPGDSSGVLHHVILRLGRLGRS